MAWTLGHYPPREEILLDNYFLAVGKALCIATNFEHKCKFILQTMTLLDALEAGEDFDAARELVKALDKKMLNETIMRIGNHPAFSAADIEILRAAKDSRNYIAHKSAARSGGGDTVYKAILLKRLQRNDNSLSPELQGRMFPPLPGQ